MRRRTHRIRRRPDLSDRSANQTGTSTGSFMITSEERDLSERTKRDLAARRWGYVQDYADARSAVVEGIIARAEADR